MKFGYMRVSTLDQNLDRQKKQLEGVPPAFRKNHAKRTYLKKSQNLPR